MAARIVTLAIPDEDSAEQTVKGVADVLRNGSDVIVFVRPKGIPNSVLVPVVKHMGGVLEGAMVALTAGNGKAT